MSPRLKGQPSSSSRQSEILRHVYASGHASVSMLSEELDVSQMTVRRDLRLLADQGLVALVHGGATAGAGDGPVPAFSVRASSEAAAKRKIGEAAVARIGANDVIGIDAGTTALEVAVHLPDGFAGTVISHSVPTLSAMLSHPGAHTVGLGGDLLPRSRCLISSAGIALASKFRISQLFLGASAVDERGIYVHSTLELDMKEALIAAADKVVLVCDRSKLGAAGAARVGALDRIQALITDAEHIPEQLEAALAHAGVEVVRV
jgi:DeoR/GlpR family transcriptional regulator of sugar metabolism